MSTKRNVLMAVAAAVLTTSTASAFWFMTDMFDMPSWKPQEGTPRDLPAETVPTKGDQPDWTVGMAGRAQLEASLSENPIAPSDASLAEGTALYAIYCGVCHGPQGMGDGPVATKAPGLRPWFPLDSAVTQSRTDQYLYAQIAAGGPVMGPYGHSLEPNEIWHLVNYIRSLKAAE